MCIWFNLEIHIINVKLSALQAVGQADGAEADADQAADRQIEIFEYAPYFAVAAFFNHDVVSFVYAFAALFADALHFGQAVFEHNAFFGQHPHLFGRQAAQRAHRIFAFHLEARMGETLHQFARGGQNQQAAGVDVQVADGDPAAAGGLRQTVENADAALRVVAGGFR